MPGLQARSCIVEPMWLEPRTHAPAPRALLCCHWSEAGGCGCRAAAPNVHCRCRPLLPAHIIGANYVAGRGKHSPSCGPSCSLHEPRVPDAFGRCTGQPLSRCADRAVLVVVPVGRWCQGECQPRGGQCQPRGGATELQACCLLEESPRAVRRLRARPQQLEGATPSHLEGATPLHLEGATPAFGGSHPSVC